MKNIQIIIIFFMCFTLAAVGQHITGVVKDKEELPLPGVNIYWSGTTVGTTSDQHGKYKILTQEKLPAQLVFSFVGFKNDTVEIQDATAVIDIQLSSSVELQEFEVVEREASTKLNTMSSLNIEQISAKELTKAACCNLSESFETNGSVDVVYSDAVSGAKKIQMLGLDGIYTQLMFENIPNVRGLSSPYGLSFIPGTWVESIQITKGTGSVVNGYEPITGQINLEYQKPDEAEKLYVNVYGNQNGRAEANVHAGKKLNGKWSTMLFAHGSMLTLSNDYNNDGFLDAPKYSQINVFNRWKNVTKKRMSQFGVKMLTDNKTAGQVNFDYNRDFGTKNFFGIGVNSRQYEVFGKTGFLMPSYPNSSIGLLANVKRHEQKSFFGLKNYTGNQNTAYFNGIFQSIIRTTNHAYKTGVSFLADDYQESFNDSIFTRTEIVPGGFFEYTYNREQLISLVLGVRGDYHNLYGFKFTPRAHFKWNFSERSAFRLTAGTGFRTPNVIVENSSVFASSRKLIVKEQLLPEEAINAGASLVHKFELIGMESSVSLDYYYTFFTNQAVVDVDKNVHEIHVYNLDGQSFSHSYQAELVIEPIERLDVKLTYKHFDVKATYHGELLRKPLVPIDRGLINIGYETANTKWQYDLNTKLFGKSRLPDTGQNPDMFRLSSYSDPYYTLSGQITRRFRKMEYYLGVENLLNYKQPNAIIAANDPFGDYFDASMIWGPVNGRVMYGGLRFRIK